MSEGCEALVEDLLTMGDEKKSVAWKLASDPRVIDCRHDGLSGPRRGTKQVSGVSLVTREVDLLKERLLERAQFDLNRTKERELRRGGRLRSFCELVSVVGDEVVIRPIALEDRLHLCDRVGITNTREPHVPFEAGDL